MRHVACFTVNGKNVCFAEPMLWPSYWPWIGDRPTIPVPSPVEIQDVRPEVVRDVGVLLAVKDMCGSLSPEVAKTIAAAADAGIRVVSENLPKGMELTVKPRPMAKS